MKTDRIKIFCTDNSELAEFEAINRGYRPDIYVKLSSTTIFHLHIYDIVRLQQDFQSEIESYGFFSIEPNIVLVKEVNMENIKITLEKLQRQNYFENIKPLDIKSVNLKLLLEI